jgi:hypothetical protein
LIQLSFIKRINKCDDKGDDSKRFEDVDGNSDDEFNLNKTSLYIYYVFLKSSTKVRWLIDQLMYIEKQLTNLV